MQKELLTRLDVIGAKLGVAANQLWALFVRQSYIDGLEYLVLFAIALCLSPWVMRNAKSLSSRDMGYSENVAGPLMWTTYAGLLIFAAIMACSACDSLVNPQLAAFKCLMASVKQ